MAFGSWTPFRREKNNGSNLPMRRSSSNGGGMTRMQDQMNRMFEDFLSSSMPSQFFGNYSPEQFVPRMDISESGDKLCVTAELPGMGADDIDVNVHGDRLQIRGEKRQEKEEEDEGYYRTERSFGSFQRTIPLPQEVDADKAEATFKNGVLSVEVPKIEGKEQGRKVKIKEQ
ncbi:MAG: Hsp20/alpha crystallin family protein [Persicimonas sp.]